MKTKRTRSSSASRLASRPWSRRGFLAVAATGLLVLPAGRLGAQEGVFLRIREAPGVLFPNAERITNKTLRSTPGLRRQIRTLLGRTPVTFWEREYPVFTIRGGHSILGYVVVVNEIGKHRPITFAVAVTPVGKVHDAAVLIYREPYGGEIRHRRFLAQYHGKTLADSLLPYRDIRNIAGATLSVEATGRAVQKAIAVLKALGELS